MSLVGKTIVITMSPTCRQCRSLCKACWWETWSPCRWHICSNSRPRWRPQSLRRGPFRCTRIYLVISDLLAAVRHGYLAPQVLQHPNGTRPILLRRCLFEESPLRNQLFDHILGVLSGHDVFWKQNLSSEIVKWQYMDPSLPHILPWNLKTAASRCRRFGLYPETILF